MFETFLKINKLTVVNSLPLCRGVTTRARMRKGVLIKSVLDFYVVCECVLASVTEMEIDNDRKYRLTNFNKVRTGGKAVDTDHMTTILKLNMKVMPEKTIKSHIFDFKNEEGLARFKASTSETDEFSKCFMNNKPVKQHSHDWMELLLTHCTRSFPKIRIKTKHLKQTAASKLIDKRNILLKKSNNENEDVKHLTEEISNILIEEGRSKAYKFKQFCDQGNTLNITEM